MLTKILPIVVATVGIAKNKDKIEKFLSLAAAPAVQVEMSNICKMIKLDSIDGNLPSTDSEKFAEYIRKNIVSQNKEVTRDFSKDMWGIGYQLEIKNQVATVISAGPDKKFGTKDDLRVSTSLY